MQKLSFFVLYLLFINATAQSSNFATLNYLYEISGKQTIAGQQNRSYWNAMNTITGNHAALWGEDFSFYNWGGTSSMAEWRNLITSEALARWNEGAVIAFTFHPCPPTMGEPCDWSNVTDRISDAQWNELITDGTTLNNNWKARLDLIAGYLQTLENNGVEVMFRPFHEMNHPYVFWWANRPGANGSARLYQITHDYLVNTKGLSNLIFVWNVQDFGTLANDLNAYDPGSAFWDVLSLDMYNSDGQGYSTTKYNLMVNKAGNKPIAIGECEDLPTKELLTAQPRWTYFMGWAELTQQKNSNTKISDVYNAANVITLNEMPGWKIVPNNLAKNKTVTVSSTEIGGNQASYATDGSYTTRWSSLYSDAEWLAVDLGENYKIEQVKITWEAAMAKDYSVQISSNGTAWTTLKTITNNTTLSNDHTGLSGTARYVRINCTSRATVYGYSIFEIEVYGKGIPKPYSGTAIQLPGIFQAENYDLGGDAVAFNDLTPANTHGAYRTDAVDIEACTDAGGGFNVGGTQAGEWLNYSVNVLANGNYQFNFRVAAVSAGKTFHIEVEGVNVSGAISVPNTGGWQTWQTVSTAPIALSLGNKNLRIVFDSELINLNHLEVVAPVITSITNLENEFNVYPNPADEVIYYQLSAPEKHQVLLFDVMGNLLLSQNVVGNKVNVSEFAPGVYQLMIVQGNAKHSAKIIIQ